jgi:pimeloyl-ACP methyl ester carboxylesterase
MLADVSGSGAELAKTELVVVLHGATSEGVADVVRAVKAARPNAEVMDPPLAELRTFRSTSSPQSLAMRVADLIDAAWEKSGGRYERIVIVGHSAGGMIARKIVILACGEVALRNSQGHLHTAAPFEAEIRRFANARPWAQKIERLILLAGLNRGWSVATAKDWITAMKFSLGHVLAECIHLFRGRYPTIFGFRSGSLFMVQTRLQWLALVRSRVLPDLFTVQMVGTLDDVVPLADAVDFDVELGGDGKSFRLLELPCSNHVTALNMVPPDHNREEANEPIAVTRWRRFVDALTKFPDELECAPGAILRDHLADALPPKPNLEVSDVVFVMHGIRDKGFWTQKVARQIKLFAEAAKKDVRSMTASYGYLAMLPFALPWVRRRKVEWLMDRYTEIKAQYPNADLSYVGHSNGTYLAAAALQNYPAARFKRIVFAGSVVPRDYDWASLCGTSGTKNEPSRVEAVLNYVATADWVVALFPKGFEPFRKWIGLGSAGHSGFDQFRRKATDALQEVHYVRGGHGAGVEESQWDDIAHFIVHGTLQPGHAEDQDYAKRQSFWVRWLLGPFATLWLAALAALVLVPGALLITAVFCGSPVPWLASRGCAFPAAPVMLLWLVALGIYLWFVRIVVTRV